MKLARPRELRILFVGLSTSIRVTSAPVATFLISTRASSISSSSRNGTLIGSALEQSNFDIAQEFTQMILAQRGYQANSKTITVSDELLMDTLNLKR